MCVRTSHKKGLLNLVLKLQLHEMELWQVLNTNVNKDL